MAHIAELLRAGRTFSFEFFPPKNDLEAGVLARTLQELEPLGPSFVSVTYRGGRVSRWPTHDLVVFIRQNTRITPMAHLICVDHDRAELREILEQLKEAGIENVLALGGDPVEGGAGGELRYAIELVELAHEVDGFSVGVAAHPAGHPRSPDLKADRENLARKLEVADFAITQFFFHAWEWERLRDDLARAGVDKPLIPGIMPITNLSSVHRMAQLSGYAIPEDIVRRVESAGTDRQDVRRAGVQLATELCADLLAAGAPGLHFYTLNRSSATREIYEALRLD
jgi:methylenetetrahydrofolate reductase (NADPH)